MHAVPTISDLLDDPDWGDECPVCGDPFTTSESGVIWPGSHLEIDAFAWDRVCQSTPPEPVEEFISERDVDDEYDSLAMAYVHMVSDTSDTA